MLFIEYKNYADFAFYDSDNLRKIIMHHIFKVTKVLTLCLFWKVLLRMEILSLRVGSVTHSSRNRSVSVFSSLSNSIRCLLDNAQILPVCWSFVKLQ